MVVAAAKVSIGQSALDPVQLSATSHGPAEARQVVVAAANASAGHAALEPVQLSATSHAPTEARQIVVAAWNVSAGQLVVEPVQVSATSQGPAEPRHTTPALPAGWVQKSLTPSHISRVQGLPSSVQGVPAGFSMSSGQSGLTPVQNSVLSHSPPEARQT
jgi:hypothetical protein